MTLPAGTRLGPYEIIAALDAGGMGEVYRASDPRIGRDVAIKVLPESFSRDRDRLRRFQQEARAAGALNHPSLLTIYDVGEENATPYLVSELLEGETLRARLRVGALSPARVVDYAIQMARGLAAAHDKGIVHRDIKPENIFIRKDGQVKILDFGLAKLLLPVSDAATTEPGLIMGTAAYMSPEQVRGEEVDHRSDIFSLGVVIYEALSGASPFHRGSSFEMMSAIVASDPPDIAISPGLQKVVKRCLEKHREARYQSAADLAFHLENVNEISGPEAPMRNRAVHSYAVASLLILLAVAGGFAVWRRNATQTASAPLPARKRIVVLPFENLGAKDDDGLADGITQEISSRLASVDGIGVISRTSAMQYRNVHKSAKDIGQELAVDYILEGTVRWARGGVPRIRLTADLIRVADDSQLWTRTFDQDLRDIFEVQADVARNVADELGVALKPAATRAPTGNVDAYQSYLRALSIGLSLYNTDQADAAERLYERAVELDPRFAAAWSRLSRLHLFLYSGVDHTPDRLNHARIALDRARNLAPRDPQTLIAEGYYDLAQQHDERAVAQFQAALRVAGDDAEALQALATTYSRQGKIGLALAETRRAVSVNPRDPQLLLTMSAQLNGLKKFSDAAATLERTIALTPGDNRLYAQKALALFRAGANPLVAERETERAPDRHDLELLETKTRLLVYGGDCAHALPLLDTWPVRTQSRFEQGVYLRVEGVWRLTCGDARRGRENLLEAVGLLDDSARQQPNNPYAHFFRGMALSYVDRADEATAENRKGVELANSVVTRNVMKQGLAETLSVTEKRKEALDLLEEIFDAPTTFPMSPNDLRYAPWWKPLRSEPRFQALLRRRASRL